MSYAYLVDKEFEELSWINRVDKDAIRRRVAREILAEQSAGKKLVRWQTDFIKFFPNFIAEAKTES